MPCIWFHGLIDALGGVAFDGGLWLSRWTPLMSTVHVTIAFGIVAAGAWLVFGRRARCALPEIAASQPGRTPGPAT